jgi:hypothetical protein
MCFSNYVMIPEVGTGICNTVRRWWEAQKHGGESDTVHPGICNPREV